MKTMRLGKKVKEICESKQSIEVKTQALYDLGFNEIEVYYILYNI